MSVRLLDRPVGVEHLFNLAELLLQPVLTQTLAALQLRLTNLSHVPHFGILFRYLIRLKFQREEILLLVFGLVIFTSGIGFYLQLSPILMTMIVGITIAQFPRESEKVMRIIHIAEKPTYLFMLIYAGALWNYRFWEEIAIIIFFIGARFLGKYLGGWIGSKYIDCGFDIPRNIGKTL